MILNDYLRREFGEKLYKISLSSGCTCPNRDGSLGWDGCIFCLNGSGAFAEVGDIDIQIENAKKRVAGKSKSHRYIAYFQSYTNTYGDTSYLTELYTKVITRPDIAILSIATRPDCLDDDKIEMLRHLTKIKPVWVELGLQTSKEESVEYIRRGYENQFYSTAVRRLKSIGVNVITHIILCLPGESIEDMKASVKFAIHSGTDGLKLQLLHILRGTDIEKDYSQGKFTLPTMEEYGEILREILPIIPDNIVIHRLTGDGDKKSLIAPLWTGDKKKTLNYISRITNGMD